MKRKPILCVDFDGVIHSYTSGWKGADVIPDPPVKGALQWLWKATEWFDVQIYSSRSKDEVGRTAMMAWMCVHAVTEFGPDHPMCGHQDPDFVYPIKFAHEKPAAFLTIDDRAVTFEGDWADPAFEPADLLGFKPWNQRPVGATGTFPRGELNDDDQGGLKMAIAADRKNRIVRVDFGKPVAWLGLPAAEAAQLGGLLLNKAKEIAQS